MLSAISLVCTYVIVMVVDALFGFRVSRACELIGLDTATAVVSVWKGTSVRVFAVCVYVGVEG